MPPPEKAKKVNTSPSPGLLQRLLGSSVMTPEMEQGIAIAKAENPNLAPVQPYGPISRLLMPQAQGYTSPGKTIYLNPTTMEGQSPQDVADTLAHEQTHVNQMGGINPSIKFLQDIFSGPNEPYHRRPDEIAAFQTEAARRARMGRTQTSSPSFMTGDMIVPQDIRLPQEKGIKVGPSSSMLENQRRKNASK